MALIDDLVGRLQALGIGGGNVTPALRRKSIMAIGDSLAASVSQYDSVNKVDHHALLSGYILGHTSADWLFQANLLNDSAMDVWGSAATGGMTIQQITDQHLPTVLAAAPDYCVCWSMTGNDMLANGETPKLTFDKFQALLLALEAGGVTPIVMTVVPCAGTSGATALEVERYNNFVSRMAAVRGYPLVDMYSALVNPATGQFKAGYSADNVHLSPEGSAVAAQELAVVLARLAPPRRMAPFTFGVSSSETSVAPGGLIPPDAGNPNIPSGWYVGGGVTTVGPQAGVAGNVFSFTRDSENRAAYMGSIPVTPGEIWDISLKVRTTVPAGGRWGLFMVDQTVSPNIMNIYDQAMTLPGFRLLHLRGRIGANMSTMQLGMAVSGAAGTKLEVGEIALRNLSRQQIPLVV